MYKTMKLVFVLIIFDNRNSSMIIQIYTIAELYQLYTDSKMSYLFENEEQIYIYCNINVKDIQQYISEQKHIKLLTLSYQTMLIWYFKSTKVKMLKYI